MVLLQWLSFFVKRSLFKPLQNINGDLHARDSPLFIHCPLRIVGFGKWRGGWIQIFYLKKLTKFGPLGHFFKGTDKKNKHSDFFFQWVLTKN